MLKGLIDDFYLEYDKKLNEVPSKNIVLLNYVLAPGDYYLVEDRNDKKAIKKLEVRKTDKEEDRGELYKEISRYDYNSVLIDMNKPVDNKKIIQSNNYLSFIVKKESLTNGKLTQERIDEYYKYVEDLSLKYSGSNDKEKRRILSEIVDEHGENDKSEIEANKKWIEENLGWINEEIKGKDYLKIYFKAPIKEYEKESERYVLPNIYNNNKYNVKQGDIVVGLPNNNMGMNDKKPYLENKTRKNTTPYLIDLEEVRKQKLFFDYLMTQASAKKNYIYINESGITPLTYKEYLIGKEVKSFNGHFLKINKGKELEIHDYDYVNIQRPENVELRNILDINYETREKSPLMMNIGEKLNFEKIMGLFNELFFLKGMYICLLKPEDYEVKTDKKLEILLKSLSSSVYDWIYKSDNNMMKRYFPNISMSIIRNALFTGYEFPAMEMYNLRESIIEMLGNERGNRRNDLMELKDGLRDKCDSSIDREIEEITEFSYAAGQVISYLIPKSRRKSQIVSSLLSITSTERMKKEVSKLFKSNLHNVGLGYKRFNSLYKMVVGYEGRRVDSDYLIGGYLMSNLMYEKDSIENQKKLLEVEKLLKPYENEPNNKMGSLKKVLRKKILNKGDIELVGVEEFSYAVGQLGYYLLSQKNGKNIKHDVALPIFRANKASKLKNEILNLFKTYAHELKFNNIKFNRMLGIILGYRGTNIDENSLMSGYLANNLLFENREKIENIDLNIDESIRECQFYDIKSKLREKSSVDGKKIDKVEELSYAVGQVMYFLLSKNQGESKTHELIKPVFNSKKTEKSLSEIMNLSKKYQSEIKYSSKRFERLKKMIKEAEELKISEIDRVFLLGGYLSNNIIYEKVDKK